MSTRPIFVATCLALLLVFVATTVFCAADTPQTAASIPSEAALYGAYYMPDAIDYSGNVFVYLHNPTKQPLTVGQISLDGQSIGKIWAADESFLEPDVRDRYVQVENERVAWYRVFPNPIPPGSISEIILRLIPDDGRAAEATLGVTLQGFEPMETVVPLSEPPFSLEYVGIEGGLDILHLYTRAQPGSDVDISRVEIDGQAVKADIHRVYAGWSYARVVLKQPWQQASYHAVGIGTADDMRAVLIRALPTPAPLGIMGNTGEAALEEYRNKLFEANLAFTSAPLDTYERLARFDIVGAYIYGVKLAPEAERKTEPVNYDRFDYGEERDLRDIKQHPALWAYFLTDEPDGRYHVTDLPRWSITRDTERANQFCRIFDPATPVYLQMDHGGYPRNMYIWGQVPDYICTHAYTLGGQEVATATQDHVYHTRMASRPRPFYYLNSGYCTRPDQRIYDPLEMHLEVYTALAEGAKSLQWYPAHGDRGLLKHPTMWTAVGAMNGVLHQALPLLSIGMPIEMPRTEGGDLAATAILCGDRAIAVVLVNRDFTADPERFVLNPAQTTVRVRLPGFMQARGVAEVNFPAETTTISANIAASSVEFSTDVQAGKILVIYSDDAVLKEMRGIHARCLKQFVSSSEGG
jgi:hypothetical protein